MRKNTVVVACALMSAAGVSRAAQIDLRLVEMSGRTTASPSQAFLDFAVQGRVTGGGGLASWFFQSIQLVGDAESRATLTRLRITNADGSYYTGPAQVNNAIGQGGVAGQYSFLPMLSPQFNGIINTSGGPFTNGPDNEIGTPSGFAGGTGLLNVPGVDADGDGRPDSVPSPNSTGTLTTAIMQNFFGQGQFVDLYRFRVTFTNFTPRTVPIQLNGPLARSFTQVALSNDNAIWGALQANLGEDGISVAGLSVDVIPAPGVGLTVLTGLALLRRRR